MQDWRQAPRVILATNKIHALCLCIFEKNAPNYWRHSGLGTPKGWGLADLKARHMQSAEPETCDKAISFGRRVRNPPIG